MNRRIDYETLKNRIADAFDTDTLCDLLRITVEDLLDAFEDRVIEYREEFSDLEDPDHDE